MLIVDLGRVAVRESAPLELFARLAAEARTGGDTPHARALASDERDVLLASTSAALAACVDDACALRALEGTPFAEPFAAAIGPFVARDWEALATSTRRALEAIRFAFGPEAEALLVRVAADLAIELPDERPTVDVVTSAIAPGPRAPIPALLSAQSRCFAKAPQIVECVITYAAIGLRERSRMFSELEKALGRPDAEQAYALVAIHAAAAAVHAWERNHEAVLRRSAAAVAARPLSWLADNWRSRQDGEPVPSFASRYVAALQSEEGFGRRAR